MRLKGKHITTVSSSDSITMELCRKSVSSIDSAVVELYREQITVVNKTAFSIQFLKSKLLFNFQKPLELTVLILFLLIGLNSTSQIRITDLHYRNDTLGQSFDLNQNVHSSVKPFVIQDDVSNYFGKAMFKRYIYCEGATLSKTPRGYKVYPLANLAVGFDNINNLTYTTGLGVGADYGKGNFFITGKFLPYYTKNNYVTDSIVQFSTVYPGASRAISPNVFYNSELIAAYKVNNFFTFLGGFGKNFFGEGYRSLLLSDNAAANPFFKIETSFSSIKYVNLYQVWRDIYQPSNQPQANALKFSASHYLSWNITKDFNLSIFESVVMGGKDSLSDRKFDLNYLNPVVFYRPVEYSTGSADNVLLGVNMSYKTLHQQTFYSQLILDEFLLSELRAGNKWWANKFGMQFGVKAQNFLVDGLYSQLEFNFVRPFTYSHKYSAQSYSTMNAPVAHPIGANFYEIVNLFSYKKGKHQFSNKITYSAYGVDTSAVNYGQNVLHSYADRDGNYGHEIMQGLKTNVFNNQFIYEYPIIPQINLYATARYNFRFEINSYGTNINHFVQIGLKSRIWNKYTDF